MDAAVLDQSRHRFARNFPAHGVETGNHHRARRVIHQDGDARGGFERADVAPFAADDAAFDFVVGQGEGGGGILEGVIAGVTLDGHADDLPRLFFRARFGFVEDAARQVARRRSALPARRL